MLSTATILVFCAILMVAFGISLLFESSRESRRLRERLNEIGGAGPSREWTEREIIRSRKFSEIPVLDRLLSSGRYGEAIELFLAQANVRTTVGTFLLMSLTLGALGMLAGVWVVRFRFVGFILAVALASIPYLYVSSKRRRRFQKFLEQFPDALELIASALRAGLAFSGAIRIVAQEMPDPVGGEFWVASEEHSLGLDIRESLVRMNRRMDIPDVRFFVTAVVLQRETGGNLAEILENTTSIIRDRFRILSEARVFSAQGRLSGMVLVCLPVVMAVILSALSPGYLKILIDDPIGKYLLVGSLFFQVIGMLAIRRIVRIRV
ncbi:MAG: type II secretion system F family protein [Candidatus Eisenbacteria bacterium]